MTSDLLIHVEDPGAANWIAALSPALAAHGIVATLVADGYARTYLGERGVASLNDGGTAPALIERLRPRALLVGTSENTDSRGLALIDAARAAGIPTAAIVDQPANAEHRFRGRDRDPLRHAPDRILVPDRRTADSFAALGATAHRIQIVGNPHHDRVLERGAALEREGRKAIRARLFPAVDPLRQLIIFVSEVGYVVNPEAARWEEENRFRGRGTTRYRTTVILEEVLDALAVIAPRPALVLRLHPKNTLDEFAVYREAIDVVSIGGDPLAIVYSGDLVVGMTSALLEEAHLMGCRTLAALPREAERAWLASLADGAIPIATDRAMLRRAIAAQLRLPPIAPVPAAELALPRLVAAIKSAISTAPLARSA